MLFKLRVAFYWLKNQLRKPFGSRRELEIFQEKQLEKFAQTVLKKSVYYQKFFKNGKLDFDSIPMISKTQFIEHFDEINTVGILKKEALQVAITAENSRDFKSEINGITVGLSTGTSGKRGVFMASENERAMWAALVMSRVIKPVFFKKQRIAFFLRANSNLYSSVESSFFEFHYFDIFRPIDELIKEVNDFQPHILAAQPSILVDIAMAQADKRINLILTQLISFAEVLHPDDKQLIQSQFTCQFSEVYQCTEGFLGATCEHGTMHLNEDFVKIEKETIEGNRFYPIITDFSRQSQPVVKYRLDDVLIEKSALCACGSQRMAIEAIIGRDDDILLFKKGDKQIKLYPDLIARRITLMSDTFHKYQVKQVDLATIEIAIEANDSEREFLQQSFKQIIIDLLVERGIAGILFVFKDTVEVTAGSKYRKIQRMF